MLARPVSLLALRRAIAAGETTASHQVGLLAERANALEPQLRAFTAADWTRAAATAAALSGTPLGGLPIGVKDIFDTSFLPTAYGSPIYAGHRPQADAAMVLLLQRAGAVLPVKTATTEFALYEPAATRNPWDLARSPGGSSSGSAAGVAAGLLPAAIGSQTVGSTLRPASFCGITGFKPSFDALPRQGMKCLAASLDTVGLFTAGVDDMRWLFAVLQGQEPRLDVPRAADLRIGLLRTPWYDEAQPTARAALDVAASALARAGVALTELALPAALAAAHAAQPVILGVEAGAALKHEYESHRDGLSARLRQFLDEASTLTQDQRTEAEMRRREARAALPDLFNGLDAVLTFAAADVAPSDLLSTGSPVFNRLWTLLGLPAISVPGLMSGNLPIGMQLVGPAQSDDHLLATASLLAEVLAPAQ